MAGATFLQRQSQGELVRPSAKAIGVSESPSWTDVPGETNLCTIRLGAQFSIYLGKEKCEHACERECKTGGMFPCTIVYNTAVKMLTTVPILMDDSLSFKVSNSPMLHFKYSQEEYSLPHSKKA